MSEQKSMLILDEDETFPAINSKTKKSEIVSTFYLKEENSKKTYPANGKN